MKLHSPHAFVEWIILLFKGPYCVSTFVVVLFKYATVLCLVALVVVGIVNCKRVSIVV